jgi:hypothetical protein
VRYTPSIALTLAGLALGIAGAVSLAIGAVYGGVAVCGLSAVTAFAMHERETAAGAKRHDQSEDAHHHGTGAAAIR